MISQKARFTCMNRPSRSRRLIPIGAFSKALRNRSSASRKASSARFRSVTSFARTSRARMPANISECDVISTSNSAPSLLMCRPVVERWISLVVPDGFSTTSSTSLRRMSFTVIDRNSSREYPYRWTAASLTARNSSESSS
jgi:hypothetical protein